MDKVRVIEIKQSVFKNNDEQAEKLIGELEIQGVFLLNLMSSPGSGKTTTLKATINALKDKLKIGVMEADIDSDVDAIKIAETGVKSIQLHTGGMCHLDAAMTKQGVEALAPMGLNLQFSKMSEILFVLQNLTQVPLKCNDIICSRG